MIKKLFFIFFILISFFSLKAFGLALASPHGDYKPEYKFSKDCHKENNQYFVRKVFDGDTILVVRDKQLDMSSQGQKIRFLGIDAFEHDQKPYGEPAYKYLSMLVLGKNVCIETDVEERDKYGRTLGYVFLREGKIEKTLRFRTVGNVMSSKNLTTTKPNYLLVNEEITKNGYAILYVSAPNVKYKGRLKKAVIHARTNMLGVWEKKDYILETPSEFRHKHPYKIKNKLKKKKRVNYKKI